MTAGRSGTPVVLGLVALALLGVTRLGEGPGGTLPGALGAGLAGVGLVAEVGAVALPVFGFFSAGFAFWFALALLPGTGPDLAVLAGLAALGLRTALRGHEKPWWRAREALADLVPLAAGLAALRAVDLSGVGLPAGPLAVRPLALLAGSGAFLFCALVVPGLLVADLGHRSAMTWGRVHMRLGVPLAALPAGGLLLAWLGRSQPLLLPPLAFLLLVVYHAASLGASWARIEERRRLERRLQRAQRRLGAAEEAGRRASQDLAVKVDEAALLEALAPILAGCTTVTATSEAVVAMVRRLVKCGSAAVFLQRPEGLLPVAWDSPHRELLASAPLLRLGEPVVERAWREGHAAFAREDEVRGSTLFPDEASRLAVPLPQHGVLYVGAPAPEAFGPSQVRRLALVAAQAALALQSTSRLEERAEALERHARAHERLEVWVGGLEEVLRGLRELLGSLDPEELLGQLGELLAVVAPHDLRVLQAGEFRQAEGSEEPAAVDALAGAVRRSGLPLLLEDVRTTRFAAPGPGIRSVLAVPLNLQEGPVGAVVLGARAVGAFGREHQDLAFMLAWQVAAAFRNARLHRELLETHQALQDSQARLVQSSKMAAVGQLAAGVAHELNTPLGAVLLGLDSALPLVSAGPERAVRRLETARKAVLQAREIVSKLLFYSRDARHGVRETDLNGVVDDTLELLGHHLRMDGVRVEKDLGPVPVVLANPNEVQQVVTNLVLNARDALADWSGERVVRLATRTDGRRAVVEVVDSGPGIPPEVQDRLFEPFFTTRPVGRGTGLGLSVSLEILKRHGGGLEFASQPGRTRFTAWLGA